MATSGSTDFTETRDQIITNSLTLLGVVGAGETVQPNDITFCASMLNSMVKGWMSQGIHLWTEEEGTLYLVNGQNEYQLVASAAGAFGADGTGTPVETTLTSTGSGSSITVATIVGMANGNTIGIVLNDNTIFWTTINGTPSGSTVVLTSGIIGAASSGNQVFTYPAQLPRVLTIQAARLRNQYGFDRTIKVVPRNDYFTIPQKNSAGSPNIIYYSPQVSTGSVYLWPCPDNVNERVKITYLRTIQDFDTGSDNPDFPQEWIECIIYNLAVRVAAAYGISLTSGGIQGNPDLLRQAAQYLDDLKGWDAEQPYIQITPGYDYRR